MTASDGDVSRETVTSNVDSSARDGLGSPVDVSRETLTASIRGQSIPVSRETTPIEREAAQAARLRTNNVEAWPRPVRPRVIAIANQKGGVGKTTSTVNIAAALAIHGLRTLVLDLDPQGNASTALGVAHHIGVASTYDVVLGGVPVASATTSVELAPALSCVPATLDLAGADIELTSQVAREFRLKRAVDAYLAEAEPADYILIDCPPSLGLLTLNALVAAREVLIPIQCEYYALEGLAQLLQTVELVRAHLNPQLAVRTVLLTMYDGRTRLADQVASEVRNHFGDLVVPAVIPRNIRVSEAPGFGQTVLTYDPGSRGAQSYIDAARFIAERGAVQDPSNGNNPTDGGQ